MDQRLTVVCSPKCLESRANSSSTAYALHLSAVYVSKKKKSKKFKCQIENFSKDILKELKENWIPMFCS